MEALCSFIFSFVKIPSVSLKSNIPSICSQNILRFVIKRNLRRKKKEKYVSSFSISFSHESNSNERKSGWKKIENRMVNE